MRWIRNRKCDTNKLIMLLVLFMNSHPNSVEIRK